MKQDQFSQQRLGVLSAAGAYILWGILPVYWKFIYVVPAQEILAHRIVWSFVFMVFVLLISKRLESFRNDLREIVSERKKLLGVIAASVLISINWYTYIWAVSHDRVVESSLGYYINPLVSVLLGIIVLKEKLSFWQIISFMLATIGVVNLVVHFGAIPWVALTLAVSFGLYGLSKKMVNVGAMTGLTLETLFISPVALLYIGYVHNNGNGAMSFTAPSVTLLLVGAGIITAVPLLLFASGAKQLPLSVIGFLQYIAPTLMLILGVFLYHEPFTGIHLASFILIWVALVIFSLSKTGLFVGIESLAFKNKKIKAKGYKG